MTNWKTGHVPDPRDTSFTEDVEKHTYEWVGRLADANKRVAALESIVTRQTESALVANEALYAKGERIAALEAIVGKQEEELHQGELRVAELEAENKRLVERLQDDFDEHCAAWTRRAEQAEAEYAACASDLVAQQALTIEQSKLREQSEAERDKWHWVATHEFRCPLGEMSPGEPGSYIVEVPVSEALVRQWEAAEREEAP